MQMHALLQRQSRSTAACISLTKQKEDTCLAPGGWRTAEAASAWPPGATRNSRAGTLAISAFRRALAGASTVSYRKLRAHSPVCLQPTAVPYELRVQGDSRAAKHRGNSAAAPGATELRHHLEGDTGVSSACNGCKTLQLIRPGAHTSQPRSAAFSRRYGGSLRAEEPGELRAPALPQAEICTSMFAAPLQDRPQEGLQNLQ